jgi:hypothetical protein
MTIINETNSAPISTQIDLPKAKSYREKNQAIS